MADVIRMPRLSDSMVEGEIVTWHKNVGDKIEKGDLLAEINSDKATMDFESPRAGSLLYVGAKAGDKMEVDSILAVIGKEGESYQELIGGAAPAAASSENKGPEKSTASETPKSAPASQPATAGAAQTPVAVAEAPKTSHEAPAAAAASSDTQTGTDNARIKASPLAKSIASNLGISLDKIAGSGDNGRITKKDVEAANAKPATTEAPPAAAPATALSATATASKAASTPVGSVSLVTDAFEDVPLTSIRKVIAKKLTESKVNAPHFYLTVEINMDKAVELRKQLNELAAPVKISYNDIVIKAAAAALKNHPAINSSWMGEFIRKNKSIHIGVAVAVGDTLFVPVVRNADMKTLSQISGEVKALAGKAKEGKLSLPEMQGNTFSISNLGMFDIEEFTAIINPPDAAILAVGSIIQKPIVKNAEIVIGNLMKITLSCDHRVIDGATGAQFVQTLKSILEEPVKLLI